MSDQAVLELIATIGGVLLAFAVIFGLGGNK